MHYCAWCSLALVVPLFHNFPIIITDNNSIQVWFIQQMTILPTLVILVGRSWTALFSCQSGSWKIDVVSVSDLYIREKALIRCKRNEIGSGGCCCWENKEQTEKRKQKGWTRIGGVSAKAWTRPQQQKHNLQVWKQWRHCTQSMMVAELEGVLV